MTAAHDCVRPVAVLEAALGVDGVACAAQLDLFEREGWLSQDLAEYFVARAWDLCGHPMQVLDRGSWVRLFRLAGFTNEFVPAPLPAGPLRLFRGSDLAGAEGMCWSRDIDVARWFAAHRVDGQVWSAVVEPSRVLACVAVVSEDQVVVDTDGLSLEVVEDLVVVAALDVEALAVRLDERAAGVSS